MDDFWEAFLTPPVGKLLTFIDVMKEHENRFPEDFLEEFRGTYYLLHGWENPAPEFEEALSGFKDWNVSFDPDYKFPRYLMWQVYVEARESMKKKEKRQRDKARKRTAIVIKEEDDVVVSAEEIEINKAKMSERNKKAAKKREEDNKKKIRDAAFRRFCDKLSATVQHDYNKYKNSFKKDQCFAE